MSLCRHAEQASLFVENLAPYEIFNLGNNQPEQLIYMIQYLGDALDIEPKMKMLPMQPGDVHVTYADITEAKAKLGYQPSIRLKEEVKSVVAWITDQPELPRLRSKGCRRVNLKVFPY